MAQVFADCREAWRRASFADHATTREVKNKISTRTRLFIGELAKIRTKLEEQSLNDPTTESRVVVEGIRIGKIAGACGLIETLFYLPNHLRQTILVNSSSISFVNKDAALLDLMNVMFRINQGENARITEFRLQNFFACYRPFIGATLPYECLSFTFRLGLFEALQSQLKGKDNKGMPGSLLLSGALSGMTAQLMCQPFFLRNLGTQNCFKQMQTSAFDRLGWVALRGSLLGVCHLTVFKSVIDFLEQPMDPFGTKSQNVDLLTKKFVFNDKVAATELSELSDGDRLLAKLCLLNYFDQKKGVNVVAGINEMEQGKNQKYQFINLVFSTFVASAAVALFLTPFDMVFFKMMAKTANMSSKAAFAQIAKDVFVTQRQAKGSVNALGFAMGATFVRYFFLLTTTHSFINSNL